MINYKITLSVLLIIAVSGCGTVPKPSSGERVSGVSISDYKILKLIRSFSFYGDKDRSETISKSRLLKRSIEKNDMKIDVFLSHRESSCLQRKDIDIYKIIKRTVPSKEWYAPKESLEIEFIYTDKSNFDVLEVYTGKASFYFYLDSCSSYSGKFKSLIIESVATAFHELVHANRTSYLFPWNSKGILEEEVFASSIGLCVKLLSKSVKAYKFRSVNNEIMNEYRDKYKSNQVFYRSVVAELIAEELFSKALSDEEGYVNTRSKRERILHECSTILKNNGWNSQLSLDSL